MNRTQLSARLGLVIRALQGAKRDHEELQQIQSRLGSVEQREGDFERACLLGHNLKSWAVVTQNAADYVSER